MSGKHENSSPSGPTGVESIARWVLGINDRDLPRSCVAQARLLLLDSIGCAIAGAGEDVCKNVVAMCNEVGGQGPCTIIGQSRALDLPHAVLANGALVRALDLNDYVISPGRNGPLIGGHPSDNIPVALAAGEARRRPGSEILATIAIGYELFGRLKGMMDRKGPWDGVSLSAFVASAMAGRLMGLDADQLAHALALSGARAATPAIVRRGGVSAAKSISNAMVAQSAVEATLLAARGVTGPLSILEHQKGLRTLFPTGDIHETMSAPFPSHGYIMRAHVKMYPCLATGQAAVAAALRLHERLRDRLDTVERIEVVMADHAFLREQQEDPGRVRPRSREAADHSFQFLVAVALADGALGPAQFENERWLDPRVDALMKRIVTRVDPDLNHRAPDAWPCAVRVRDASGEEHAAEVLFPPGYSRDGMSVSEVIAKFHSAAASLGRDSRERIVAAVLAFDRAASADDLGAALRR